MHWLDWLITLMPVAIVLFLAVYSKKHVRGVVDFLAAGRYVISAGDLTAGLSVITLVALVETKYQVGYALSFWEYLTIPVGVIMGLTGYCVYRFRETGSLTIGQFLEMRYCRPFRIVAATIRLVSEIVTNTIGPAIVAIFIIYFLRLPLKVMILGVIPTVWFLIGGIIDIRKLFLDLAARIDDLLESGMVEGYVSIIDKAVFEARGMENDYKDV